MLIPVESRVVFTIFLFLLACLFIEPALANKFETIGSGVSGSTKIKIEYLKVIALVGGGIFLISSVLAVVTHNKNSQTLNFTMWRSSAVIFFLLSLVSFAAAVFM